jgi:ribosomal protein S18 acetylase RimI-like enzyme
MEFCAVMGKAEGRGEDWHGHVTCLTVAPEYRRLGLAEDMMNQLERVSEHMYELFANTPFFCLLFFTLLFFYLRSALWHVHTSRL